MAKKSTSNKTNSWADKQKTTTKKRTDWTGFFEKITSNPAKNIIKARPKNITSVNIYAKYYFILPCSEISKE